MEASSIQNLSTFIFTDFDGFIFEAEKPFENVCATETFPVQLRECLFLHLFDCKLRTLLLSLSINLQQLKKLCRWMEWQRKQKEKR